MQKLYTQYDLILTNTLTNKVEKFIPQFDSKVLMYVCGITPYDYAHIGHGRCYVTFDVLFRLLQFLGYEVTYARNFTDVDDKLINRAEKENQNPHKYLEIANHFINAYHTDMHALNCLPPTFEPRVTQTIDQIIDFVLGLIKLGKAYVAKGDVYFSISDFPQYGKLSKRDLSELQAGARVQIREDKKNPLDFALWKSEPEEQPGWPSPWGWGRPGWHIECSAMSKQFLGETIDIHAGGMDLIFPHHENEVAQSEGLSGKTFARYWLHNAFVRVNQEKMSKSLGNFVTLNDLFKQFHPQVVRFYFLNHQYRSPLDFSFEDLSAFIKSYNRLVQVFDTVEDISINSSQNALKDITLLNKLINALCDDLNTAKLFGILFENIKDILKDKEQAQAIKNFLKNVLGLTLEALPIKEIVITPQIERLITERDEARKNKDWAKADELRTKLKDLGFEVQDKKTN